jgi:hypothetical protein
MKQKIRRVFGMFALLIINRRQRRKNQKSARRTVDRIISAQKSGKLLPPLPEDIFAP